LGFFRRQRGQKSKACQPVWKIAQPRRPVWKITSQRRPVWKNNQQASRCGKRIRRASRCGKPLKQASQPTILPIVTVFLAGPARPSRFPHQLTRHITFHTGPHAFFAFHTGSLATFAFHTGRRVSQCIQHPVPVLHSRLYYSLTITNAQDQSCPNQEPMTQSHFRNALTITTVGSYNLLVAGNLSRTL
jgi:hypothetical protein